MEIIYYSTGLIWKCVNVNAVMKWRAGIFIILTVEHEHAARKALSQQDYLTQGKIVQMKNT